ncbi:hypothetical protein CH35J_011175 [Colletotrichum higginsianum]|uniref:Uncharacterized protein n=1 Tax=Colletotrichum higginsianum TaxID=80884 RepID=A0A4T0VH24_9PEZI|nr:hypothetical protein CH35J_011175 [Colletotrichum higginsianum]
MDGQKTSSTGQGGGNKPPRHKHVGSSSSLGSLYEVLADLDDTQLQYLIQEMNHTGHRNVPVSQAVSALEAQAPTNSLVFTGPVPPASVQSMQAPQRRLSKSQQGKLRLQTAFRRVPSLRLQERGHDSPGGGQVDPDLGADADTNVKGRPGNDRSLRSHPPLPPSPPSEQHHDSVGKPGGWGPIYHDNAEESPRSNWGQQQPIEKAIDAGSVRPSSERNRRESPAYRRIPRPDFNLPAGVTVVDLLQLLEVEYQSSNSPPSSPPSSSSSPSSCAFHLPKRRLPAADPRHPNQTPNWPESRPLRRHTSRLDMALDVERGASGAMEIGMSMLEPRQLRSVSLGAPGRIDSAANMSLDPFERHYKGESPSLAPPVVYEGIFDVLENR